MLANHALLLPNFIKDLLNAYTALESHILFLRERPQSMAVIASQDTTGTLIQTNASVTSPSVLSAEPFLHASIVQTSPTQISIRYLTPAHANQDTNGTLRQTLVAVILQTGFPFPQVILV
jgi:hypothetical protein